MKKLTIAVLAVYIVLLSGCAIFNKDMQDIQVEAQADPKANLSGYKTFAWLGAAKLLNDPTKKWQPPEINITEDIKFLIDRELRNKDINVNDANPDLAVAFFVGVDMDVIELVDDPATEGNVLENIPQGALVVALVDVQTGYVVWVGMAKANINEDASPELVRARLDYAVTEIFKLLK